MGKAIAAEVYADFIAAERAATLGDWEEAIRLYRRVLPRSASDPFVQARLGEALEASGRSEQATALFQSALRADPRSEALLLAWSRVRFGRGERKEALALLGRARAAVPNSPDIALELARQLRAAGALGRASAALEAAIDASSTADLRLLRAHFELALERGDEAGVGRAAALLVKHVPVESARLRHEAERALEHGKPALALALLAPLALGDADLQQLRALLLDGRFFPDRDSDIPLIRSRLSPQTWATAQGRRLLASSLRERGLPALADEILALASASRP